MEEKRPVILVVDDEPGNIEILGETLGNDYERPLHNPRLLFFSLP